MLRWIYFSTHTHTHTEHLVFHTAAHTVGHALGPRKGLHSEAPVNRQPNTSWNSAETASCGCTAGATLSLSLSQCHHSPKYTVPAIFFFTTWVLSKPPFTFSFWLSAPCRTLFPLLMHTFLHCSISPLLICLQGKCQVVILTLWNCITIHAILDFYMIFCQCGSR